MRQPLGRRALLLGTGGLLVGTAGCTATSRTAAGPSTSASTPQSSSPPLPTTTAWRPGRDDVDPDVKLRAVQVVEAIGAWPAGQGSAAAAKKRVAALGAAPSLVDSAGPLRPDESTSDGAALQVIDAQYGGILADTASVMVVCRQWTPGHAGGTTVDVRLSRARPRWEVTALHPGRPGAAAASLPAAARQVLADPRIGLPPAAEADIRSGHIHPAVLRALLRLAGAYRMDITVFRSGHPLYVFGTDRPSDHPPGRAFDVWRIDGHEVVDPATPHRLTESFMRDAAAAGSYNVGGPIRLTGGAMANQFFTDATHHDHVHVGFAS
ncbi:MULTISPECIES: hypothetical protein [unclassified Streptomyces]|uniref:hypothetical protein n=1 Tax=unclassified Streptomyces TaxID=2593676 RepID=UPI0022584B6E|nr:MULTISPECIES: hypothetical protein [unclassified Streptomyces]WSU25828.1 hypothetical protein OG508_36225 [Streptomyces sp. NBC_01108]MCX4784882.1 hypothetical protein [Streptomyces sp. NBC_01221]MCX4799165.1 hypothetical protein [Streptomyces sp. NBC_01242]WSJ40355.1 hypothetical protein OG772_33170 [Streptomyces sp. NBC_01321]WSP66662.1 hypothetical protein OG466_35880 [Streptomyces sp. NBC_01240]